jgi:hypothetical protein
MGTHPIFEYPHKAKHLATMAEARPDADAHRHATE